MARGGRLVCVRPRRCAINQPREFAENFAESYVPEDTVTLTARIRAREVGAVPVSRAAGAVLRMLAAAVRAKAVVEVGTGTGVSGLWLLRGMRADGILTTIDIEAEHQRLARKGFAEAGLAASRTRIITGRALDVLPRLADGAYDLVLVDADPTAYAQYVAEALRLLRAGGLLVLARALGEGGRVADPAARDPESVALREVVKAVRDADEWIPALVHAGLLAAARR